MPPSSCPTLISMPSECGAHGLARRRRSSQRPQSQAITFQDTHRLSRFVFAARAQCKSRQGMLALRAQAVFELVWGRCGDAGTQMKAAHRQVIVTMHDETRVVSATGPR
jgi:hypothetical protein